MNRIKLSATLKSRSYYPASIFCITHTQGVPIRMKTKFTLALQTLRAWAIELITIMSSRARIQESERVLSPVDGAIVLVYRWCNDGVLVVYRWYGCLSRPDKQRGLLALSLSASAAGRWERWYKCRKARTIAFSSVQLARAFEPPVNLD